MAINEIGGLYPGAPTRVFKLGLDNNNLTSQVQQIKQVTVTPASTQGVPQPVNNLTVTRMKVSATQYKLTIAFSVNPDPYFQSAQVYLKQGPVGSPVLVASGQSPLVITVSKKTLPSTIVVQSLGRWGSTSLAHSPVKAMLL